MARTKTTEMSTITAAQLADGDWVPVVDVSDTTMSSTGTNKKLAKSQLAEAAGVTAHLADTSDAHDASAISFSATGNLSSTDVQAAIAELDAEKAAVAAVAGLVPIARVSKPTSAYRQRSGPIGSSYLKALDLVQFTPVHVIPGHTYSAFGVYVAAADTGGTGVARIGLYEVGPAGQIGDLIVDGGTANTTTIGQKDVAISWTADKSLVYVATVFQGSVTSLTAHSPNNNSGYFFGGAGLSTATNSEAIGTYYQGSVSGALPSTPTPAGPGVWNTPATPPCITYY